MRVNSTRPAAVAGTWYPAVPGALVRDVDGYLAAVDPDAIPRGRLDAVIAPHAGLMFSGPVGAFAYKAAAAEGPFDAVILVGPSHFVAFDGVALYPSGAFESPLGPAPIDERLGQALLDASPVIHAMPAAHAREHSLEMQLPFIRRLLPDAAIVPLLMGYQTRETIKAWPTRWRGSGVAADHAENRSKQENPARRQHGSLALLRRAVGRGARRARRGVRRRVRSRAAPGDLRGIPGRGARTLRRLRRRPRDRGDDGGAGARRGTAAS